MLDEHRGKKTMESDCSRGKSKLAGEQWLRVLEEAELEGAANFVPQCKLEANFTVQIKRHIKAI